MKISIKQKDKILKWICKKSGISKLFLDNGCLCCRKMCYGYRIAYQEEYYLFAEEDTISIECNSNNGILEKIIDFSEKGYTISNCVFGTHYIKILSPFTSLEQLAIEADLYD